MNLFEPPPGYHRIKRVDSFDELVSTRFADDINALCWPRALPGDFGEVVEQLGPGSGIETIDDTRLRRLSVSAAGRAAIERLLEDERLLRELNLDPVLNCIHAYPRDEQPGPVPTDVFRSTPTAPRWRLTPGFAPITGRRAMGCATTRLSGAWRFRDPRGLAPPVWRRG